LCSLACAGSKLVSSYKPSQDLQDFERRLRLREYVFDPEEEEEEPTQQRRFKEKSNWTPQRNRQAPLETCIQAVKEDLWKLTNKLTTPDL